MGFLLFILSVTLFSILKYFKLDYIVVANMRNQVIFHIIEAILFFSSMYLMESIMFGLFLYMMFLPASIYHIHYADEDSKNN